jgi:hypothetical protein
VCSTGGGGAARRRQPAARLRLGSKPGSGFDLLLHTHTHHALMSSKCVLSRPDFALNGFLPVGFQTDQKSREKNGDPESVPGLACFDVLWPSHGITGTSSYNIWRLHCVAGDMGLIWVYASKIGKQFIWLFV